MKKLLMFCMLGIIYAGNAFGLYLASCNLKLNCGDGEGTEQSVVVDYDYYYSFRQVPNNIVCSKPGSMFSHWAVSMPNGEVATNPIAVPGELYDMRICNEDELILTAVYVSNGTITSKPYVDRKISTKQITIPVTGTNSGTIGESVVTYTSDGNGVIGERGIYSDSSSYNASTDADKLITASALNTAFTTLPETPTTKLVCENQSDGCTLWTIVDQLAYGKNASCKAYGERTTSASECCSGTWDGGLSMLDFATGLVTGTCGCRTNNDCNNGQFCDNHKCRFGVIHF